MVSNDFVLFSATRPLTICSMGGAYLVVPQVSLWLIAGSIWTGRASEQVRREHLTDRRSSDGQDAFSRTHGVRVYGAELFFRGADDGNRTRVFSLGS
jgi:hypothetical protein